MLAYEYQIKRGVETMKQIYKTYDLLQVQDKEIEYHSITYDPLSDKFNTPQKIYDLLETVFRLSEQAEEILVVICLDVQNKIVALYKTSHGSLSGTIASPREIFKRAIISNSNSIILAHNHPSGSLEASKADIEGMERLKMVGDLIGIPLTDSFIVSSRGYLSFKEEGIL